MSTENFKLADRFSYELGRLNGIFEGLAYVNNKVNSGFSFQIVGFQNDKEIETATAEFLRRNDPTASSTLTIIESWQEYLTQLIDKWLFSYQPRSRNDGFTDDYLHDLEDSFSMSQDSFRAAFIAKLIDSLADLLDVKRGFTVRVSTDSWYACQWNDVVLEGTRANVFIHFGVSD